MSFEPHSLHISFFSIPAFCPFECTGAGKRRPFAKNRVGLSVGPLFFLGDLGGNVGAGTQFFKDIDWEETKMGLGAQLNFYPTKWISLRTGIYHGAVSGNDRHSPNVTANDIFRFNRNLHFRSRLR
ncbi:MAG: hypothetical protein EBQ65_01165 [Chitinophagaceae bacterium]|nr:hypothetical protein [Chitinophagaceae bacterium]